MPTRLIALFRPLFGLMGALILVCSPSQAAIEEVAPPADGIFDDTRALSEASHRDLAAEVSALRSDLKADVWLTATSFTASGVTLRQQARTTRGRWSGEKSALLIAYDRATNAVAFSFSPDLWERYPTASIVDLIRGATRTLADANLSLEERLALILHDTGKRLRQLETVRIRHDMWFQPLEKRFALVLAAVLAGAVFAAAILGLAARQRDTADAHQHYFPDVVVGTRLGAPFGGGLIAEVRSDPPR